jgi:hypothetical protein
MKEWSRKLQDWFSAVAFAEAGEHEAAVEMAGVSPQVAAEETSVLETLNNTFAAAAFAEANCHDAAVELMRGREKHNSFLEAVGLKGVKVWYGKVPLYERSFAESVGLAGANLRLFTVRL